MNLDKLMGLSGLELEIGLKTISIEELQAAVAAEELEIEGLKASISAIKAAQEKKRSVFGDYFDTDSYTKQQLLGKLKKLRAEKNKLIEQQSVSIKGFKVKEIKTDSINRNRYRAFMERLPESERTFYRENYGSDTVIEMEILIEETGVSVEMAEEMVTGRREIINFTEEEETTLF